VAGLIGSRTDLALRYQPAVDAGLTEERVAALPRYPASDLFTTFERICVNFAETFVMDPHAITDEDCEAIKDVLGSRGFVDLTFAIGLFDGFSRFRAFFGIEPERGKVVAVRPDATAASAH
jgi:alkylhydroperoxidase family enzyme